MHVQGCPEIRNPRRITGTNKVFASHSENGERRAVHFQDLADDIAIGIQPSLPIGVAQDDDRARQRRAILSLRKRLAYHGVNSQNREVICGNQLAA